MFSMWLVSLMVRIYIGRSHTRYLRQHPDKKHMVLCGRLRGTPNGEVAAKPFSLFFGVTRVEKDANLTMEYTETAVTPSVKMPWEKEAKEIKDLCV